MEERLLAGTERLVEAPGELRSDPELAEQYLKALESLMDPGESLAGQTIVLDTANGSASPFAERLFRDLGAEVFVMANRPDGSNINSGSGSTAPAAMVEATRKHQADLGIAFDGDSDRAVFCDDMGVLRDGDATLYLWSRQLVRAGQLDPPKIVATSMSNLGLERALADEGIDVVRCDVGDRTVVTTMQQAKLRLGGEQSGHIIDLELSTTGDGMITALQLARLQHQSGEPISRLLEPFQRFPQVLQNIRVARKPDWSDLPEVSDLARQVEKSLGSSGRLVLRYSGTEPLARVMIEGPDQAQIEALAARLVEAIDREIGID